MPPKLALLLTIAFVIFLFRRESKRGDYFNRALWIPLLWVLITGSRFVSQWLTIWGLLPAQSGSMEEGSPLDAVAFMALIAAGFVVLRRRQINVGTIARNNVWLTIFFVYCFVAIIWSDFPFVAFKRWIKVLGHPIMALILLTEPNPVVAVRSLMKRAAFVLLPGSILLIKYFPEYGRGFDAWTGRAFNQGVNLSKNELGYVCMLFGVFFFWNLLQARQLEDRKARRAEMLLSGGFLFIAWWLLSMANSATSLACLVIGAVTMVSLGLRWVNKKYLGLYVVVGVVIFGTAETLLGVYANVVEMLGRDSTLTDRTEVWADALKLATNPVLGAGFESFWLGPRLDVLWDKWWWRPNQAHNGYIETYLNLGMLGVFLLLAMVVATFMKIKSDLLRNFEFGRFRLGLLVMILVYNFTEATFKGASLVWTVFHIIAMDYPQVVAHQSAQFSEHIEDRANTEPSAADG